MSRYSTQTVPAIASRLAFDLPTDVTEALATYADVRKINPAPRPIGDFTAPVLAATPKGRETALSAAIAAHGAERDRPVFLRALTGEVERNVEAVVRANRDEIVSSALTSASVVEAGKSIALHAPQIPAGMERSPSLERTPPALVASVAHVAAAWSVLVGVLRDLDPLMPGDANSPLAPALLVASIEYLSEADTHRVASAILGHRDGMVSGFASTLPGATEEDRRRGLVIPAAALAAVEGVTLSLATSREQYAARLLSHAEATASGRWRPVQIQTSAESWMPSLASSGLGVL